MNEPMNEPLQCPRTELGRISKALGLGYREVPSPPGSAPWENQAPRHLPTHPGLGVCPTCGTDLIVWRNRRGLRAKVVPLWCSRCHRVLSTAERARARQDVIDRWGA